MSWKTDGQDLIFFSGFNLNELENVTWKIK